MILIGFPTSYGLVPNLTKAFGKLAYFSRRVVFIYLLDDVNFEFYLETAMELERERERERERKRERERSLSKRNRERERERKRERERGLDNSSPVL